MAQPGANALPTLKEALYDRPVLVGQRGPVYASELLGLLHDTFVLPVLYELTELALPPVYSLSRGDAENVGEPSYTPEGRDQTKAQWPVHRSKRATMARRIWRGSLRAPMYQGNNRDAIRANNRSVRR